MNMSSGSSIRLSVCVPPSSSSSSQSANTYSRTTAHSSYLPPSRGEVAKEGHTSPASHSGFGYWHSSGGPWLCHQLNMVCCCLCCPVYRCALWLCLFEIFVSLLIWYNLLDFIVKTFEVLQLKDVLVFLVLSAWLVTLFTSTGTLILAERKKNSEYVLPRIVQQAGLLILAFLGVLLLIFYFTGGSASINNALISTYEFLVLENPLTKDERKDAHDSLKYIFMLFIVLDFFFICYTAFGLAITRKYQRELETNYPNAAVRGHQGQFKPLSQNAPTAPPPPHNPSYNPA